MCPFTNRGVFCVETVEDPGLGTLVEAPLQFPVEGGDAPLEGEHLLGELCDDGGGDVPPGQLGVLAPGSDEGPPRQGVRRRDTALLEVGDDPLAPRPADRARGPVAGDQLERTPGVEVERPLQQTSSRTLVLTTVKR